MRAIATLIICAFVSGTALAQVYKCKDASGSITYSNLGCQTSHSGRAIMRERSFDEKMREREEAYEAEMLKQERPRIKAEQQAAEDAAFAQEHARQAAAANAGPSYSQRLQQRNAGVSSTINRTGQGSHGMTRAQREIALSQANTPEARAAALREATTVLPGAHGLTASQMDAAQRIHSAKPGQPIPPSTLPPSRPMPASSLSPAPETPSAIVNCDQAGCWDTNGQRLNNAAGGNFHRSDGKFCTRAGPNVICN